MNIKCFIDLLKSVTTSSNLGKSSVQTFVLGQAAIFKFATEVESGYIHGDRQINRLLLPLVVRCSKVRPAVDHCP
jgi:hypothetical protein